METPSSSAANKAWFLFGAATLGMLIFAGLYFFGPKPQASLQTVTQNFTNTEIETVTNEVVREVPKEVEKIVNVPAEIPEGYISAMNVWQKMTNATIVNHDQVLFKMKDVRTLCLLNPLMKTLVSEDEVKAKFELTLRRNNVPINPSSDNVVNIDVEAIYDAQTQAVICYTIYCYVSEYETIFRQGEAHAANVTTWDTAVIYGTVGIGKAHDGILDDIETRAELFANDFLNANPKPQ